MILDPWFQARTPVSKAVTFYKIFHLDSYGAMVRAFQEALIIHTQQQGNIQRDEYV